MLILVTSHSLKKLVSSNVFHICTRAPNVYFEDDNAINLEAEISRSRRIKCSFCGTKGAALGCYEKSCRRSFHVPCAKWTSQCRWDMVRDKIKLFQKHNG